MNGSRNRHALGMPSAQQTADQAAMDQIMAVQLRILEQKMQHAKEAQRRAGQAELQHEETPSWPFERIRPPPRAAPAPPPPAPPKPPSYMHLLEEQQRRYERIDAQHRELGRQVQRANRRRSRRRRRRGRGRHQSTTR